MRHETIAHSLVETHTSVGKIWVGHLDVSDAGTDTPNALSHKAFFKLGEQSAAYAIATGILTEIDARLASKLIGGPFFETAGIGITEDFMRLFVLSHKIWVGLQSMANAAFKFTDSRYVVFKCYSCLADVGSVDVQ